MNLTQRYCLCCAKPFDLSDSLRPSRRNTCSDECSFKLRRRPFLDSVAGAEPQLIKIQRCCLNCGKRFCFMQDRNRDPSNRRSCGTKCEAALKEKASAHQANQRYQALVERDRQIAATVNAPKLADLEARLAFYQQRGLAEQVRVLRQQINELLGA